MQKEYIPVPLVTASSTLALSEVNANTKLYMRIWFQNLTTLLFLLVKITSSSCGVVGRLNNRTLPFSLHRENCGLLLHDFVNRSLIHIFALQNPQIMSISPQSHRVEVYASLSPNNCNASLPRKGYAHVAICCTIHHSRSKRLLQSCGISDGPTNSVRYLARRSLYMRLWRSRADFDVSWLNYVGALICGTWFPKELVCSSFCLTFGCCWRTTKVAKALPCYAMSAHICSCMSSGIMWRIYVGFVNDIDIKILEIMKCWSAILRAALVMEEKLQIQKVNTWDRLLMRKLQNLATTIRS